MYASSLTNDACWTFSNTFRTTQKSPLDEEIVFDCPGSVLN